MLKIAILVWLMLATVFAGAAVLTVLALPSLAGQDMRLIPIAAGVGALIAIPFSVLVAKRILALTARSA
ncbi:hypothetical protein GGQ86_002747 [Xanthobacter flavus]|uniref:Uncharacterized protein n=1 Tax=Xanthobacter flavus TaxID=281 RepID=A0A9W6CIG2_XANFL|nr:MULTISPECIES: hypothetical protein [Xanthobacter]MBN8917048.1 hypothetical protein [Hyphomicrobiales bacterium]MDR6334271.1 hypothetical protein [Xanthobacter flavus]NMN58149.1 hypothetical protein [Xanthobacter sp. SG618]UDQ87547.1 hypothetical protein LJE71_14670 [Xanthobacter autotrophicus]GLI22991.1 hypothetical protein XFLAVUS301_26650 [Xanthobacter flavus]